MWIYMHYSIDWDSVLAVMDVFWGWGGGISLPSGGMKTTLFHPLEGKKQKKIFLHNKINQTPTAFSAKRSNASCFLLKNVCCFPYATSYRAIITRPALEAKNSIWNGCEAVVSQKNLPKTLNVSSVGRIIAKKVCKKRLLFKDFKSPPSHWIRGYCT